MFIDLWIFGIFAALVGFCAVWNRRAGYIEGVHSTIEQMLEDKLISFNGNRLVPYKKDLTTE